MRRQTLLAVAVVSLAALGIAGCGSSTSSPSAAGDQAAGSSGNGTVLHLEADSSGALEFNKTSLEAPAGKVTIEMTNPSSVPHDVAIEGNGVDVAGKVVTNGGTSTVTADLRPGTYTFLCTVDSHAEAGMEGTLTVR